MALKRSETPVEPHYKERTLKWLLAPENRIERFTVSADMGEDLHKKCATVRDEGWRVFEERANETVYWSEVEFLPGDWARSASEAALSG